MFVYFVYVSKSFKTIMNKNDETKKKKKTHTNKQKQIFRFGRFVQIFFPKSCKISRFVTKI